MTVRSFVACLAGAPLLMAAAPEPVPTRLTPSSQWVLDYADNACQLIRTFGEGEQRTVLLIESPAPDRMSMLIVGKPLATSLPVIPAAFLPGDNPAFMGTPAIAKGGDPAVLWTIVPLTSKFVVVEKSAVRGKFKPGDRPPAIDLKEKAALRLAREAFASAATGLKIGTLRNNSVILETGSLGKPIKLFEECTRDSLREWGVDPDLEDKIARPVWAPDPSQWFSTEDYPRAMVMRAQETEIRARLLVDAAGKVTSCTSLSHFDAPEFNKVVCDIFKKRARLEPAELADGTKVASYYTAQILFRMP